EAADGPRGFAFRPGQFNMLYHFGVGEVPISISGDAGAGKLIHTIRDVGAVTHGLSTLKKGDMVGVRGPFGSAWPVDAAEGSDVVIVAGGIGLAPLRPAIQHVLDNRDRYGRFVILYGARSPKDVLYLPELQ
ncbi:MAG: Ni/Fe hydrogenase subunit gamma, partial [Alphaproteobacteria bacterium]|nr:Ni/Fe hydrogenase subunit gamma [Alphaproteobacteria bacterium]